MFYPKNACSVKLPIGGGKRAKGGRHSPCRKCASRGPVRATFGAGENHGLHPQQWRERQVAARSKALPRSGLISWTHGGKSDHDRHSGFQTPSDRSGGSTPTCYAIRQSKTAPTRPRPAGPLADSGAVANLVASQLCPILDTSFAREMGVLSPECGAELFRHGVNH